MVAAGLAQSAGDARRLIDGGGVKVNDEVIPAKSYNIAPEALKDAVIKVGKRKFLKISSN
jgi:tyrosyl-tRNA synthetase